MRRFQADMPPRWGLESVAGVPCYRHVAPLGLRLTPHGSAGLEAEIQQGMKELEGMLK